MGESPCVGLKRTGNAPRRRMSSGAGGNACARGSGRSTRRAVAGLAQEQGGDEGDDDRHDPESHGVAEVGNVVARAVQRLAEEMAEEGPHESGNAEDEEVLDPGGAALD